ncbi:hypothetical protein ACIQM3_12335 [Streptomyces sp. NPDC091271]|uniref:hypothetical protein n=1 Tax=Streptomyces sp. NPDC091271 TaxID=3365980 RepID=UPI003808E43D
MKMVISRRAVRGGFLGVAMAGSLILGGTGCGGGDDEAAKDTDTAVAGTQLCGGGAVSADAADALKVITGSSRFEASGAKSTVANAAGELSEGFTSSTTGDGDVCRIYAPDDELRITWQLSGSSATDDPASKFTVLKMGERALTATDGAYLRFACRSGKLPGSEPAHIDIGVERGGMPTEPEGDPDALKDAYATVAHSFSLAMAKELGCENDGGLEAMPSLDPA